MGVQLKIRPRKIPTLRPQDYRGEAEESAFLQGIVIPTVIFVLPALVFVGLKKYNLLLGWVGWLVLSFILVALVIGQQRRRLIRQGLKIKVMPTNFPEIREVLQRFVRPLGLKEPEAYVVEEDSLELRTRGLRRPFFMVIPQRLRDLLSETEFQALLAREIGHVHARHVPLRSLALTLQTGNPILRLLGFPLFLYAFFLRPWLEAIETTADRLALLLIRDHKVISAALLKLAVGNDPTSSVEVAEIDEFISKGGMEVRAEDVDAHYRMGVLRQKHEDLFARLYDLSTFESSQEARKSLQTILEAERLQSPASG
ncbi:MAG TPA: hypothetical protein EYP85_04950 [Armatimonadetes bacterium]|nr:hypothetical protein [Armatimonadota bacterium]